MRGCGKEPESSLQVSIVWKGDVYLKDGHMAQVERKTGWKDGVENERIFKLNWVLRYAPVSTVHSLCFLHCGIGLWLGLQDETCCYLGLGLVQEKPVWGARR